ncbi:hypothetical protein KR200_008474, partial [Drosophila serrata]
MTTGLCSTQQLILEFKQFKAAQLIQRHVRGWLVRFRNRKFERAAIIIQKWWRRFMAEGILVMLAEAKLQRVVNAYHNRCASIIQSSFRGWWSRKHVNDLTKLRSLQSSLAEYLISVLGVHLHEVKHKGQVPGLYWNNFPTKCSATIDKLMATLDYRIYNAFSCYRMQKKMAEVHALRTAFEKSEVYTFVPFHGFDDRGLCEGRKSVQVVENGDNANLVRAFVCQKHDMDMKTVSSHILAEKSIKQALDITTTFLKRIAHDMKKWHDADGNMVLPKTIFKMKDIKALLDEVKENLEEIYGPLEPCNC